MTKEAKRIVAALRVVCDERSCEGCPCSDWCYKRKVNCLDDDAANMIEYLSAQLDAAVRDMGMTAHCDICGHHRNNGGNCIGVSMCGEHRPRWQWRGVEVEHGT